MLWMILSMMLVGQMMGAPEEPPFDFYFGALRNRKIASEIGLTADQQKKINDIHYSYAKKLVDLRAEVQRKNIDLNRIIELESYKKEELESLLNEIGSLEAQIRLNRIMELSEIRKVLTNEQREKLRELMRKQMERRRDKRQEPKSLK